MPTKESKPKGISREKLAREVVKRIAYRFPNGKVYYQTLEGVLDYLDGHKDDVEKLSRAAQDVLVKVRNGAAHEEAKTIGLEGRLAVFDDTPEVGDLVVVTDGRASFYAKEGSYGQVQSISDDGETAHVEFYHLTGTDGKGKAPVTPYPWDVRMQDIRKALVLEEGRWEVMYGNRGKLSAQGKKPFAVMRSDRNRSPLGDTTLSSAAQTKTAHERGLIGGAIHYVVRVTGDHLVATLALAAAVYVVNCGIQYLRTPHPHATPGVSHYTPAQQMLLMPAITVIPEDRPPNSESSAGDGADPNGKKGLKIPLSEEEVLRKGLRGGSLMF